MQFDLVVPALKNRDSQITETNLVKFLDGELSWKDFLCDLGLSALVKHFSNKEEVIQALKKALVRKPDLVAVVSMYTVYGNTSYAYCNLDNKEQMMKFIERARKISLFRTEQRLLNADSKDGAKVANESIFLLRCALTEENADSLATMTDGSST